MSITSNRNSVARLNRDIADLTKKMADESRKEAGFTNKIVAARNSITKSSSANTIETKLKLIAKLTEDLSKVNIKKADFQKKLAQKETERQRYQTALNKDEVAENKKRETELKAYERRLQESMAKQNELIEKNLRLSEQQLIASSEELDSHADIVEYDVFISHASEDKEIFVSDFAKHLQNLGINVWYDEFSLKWGDSLRKSIDRGLANSRFGIVVISKSFMAKKWTEYELNGLVAGEIGGTHRILPIWHEVSKSEVFKFSPSLADKLAMNTTQYTVSEIAEQLLPLLSK